MPVGFQQFNLLPPAQQLLRLRGEGTFLAARWEAADAVLLYHLAGGFFCEVYYVPETDAVLRTRCFSGSEGLAAYTHDISLSDLAQPK